MSARVLVAGVGNVFFADDGFGVEVARRLSAEVLPYDARVVDYGIRGVHLAFELLEPPELLMVVDAVARGGEPGTLYVIDPEHDAIAPAGADAHGMDLGTVFATVRAMGGCLPRSRIVGCEPQALEPRMGLSPVVEQAVERAAAVVRRVIEQELGRPG